MKFIIEGIPPKKDRPRFTRAGHTYSTPATKEGEQRVKYFFLSAFGKIKPVETACKVYITAYYTTPTSWSRKRREESIGHYKITKPDVDNVIKAVLDGLNGLAYKDDNLVAIVECCKKYGARNYTEVEIVGLQ